MDVEKEEEIETVREKERGRRGREGGSGVEKGRKETERDTE